jgi:phage terminase large subunit
LANENIFMSSPPFPIRPVTSKLTPQQSYGFPAGSKQAQFVKVCAAVPFPDRFAKECFGTDLWKTQVDILNALLTKPRVAVKACHSSAKTHTAAIAVLWFLAKYTEVVVVTTAPTWGQVERLLWGEIHAAVLKSKLNFGEVLNTEIHLGPKRLAYGLSTSVTKSDEGVKFQGIHAANVLMILDEAPGVHPKIWEAIEGARAGGNVRVLAIGNPTMASGPFHDAFTENRGDSARIADVEAVLDGKPNNAGWTCFTISAFDTPNLIGIPGKTNDEKLKRLLVMSDKELDSDEQIRPYLTRRRWVKEKYYEWGEGHPLWESRVLGEFPKQGEDALLSLSWLEAAKDREPLAKSTDKVVAGLDVAGPGEAETSLTVRRGPDIILHKQWPKEDPRGEVVQALMPFKAELSAVNVDAVAIGWYIYKHLEDMKFPAVPIIAQAASNDSEKYADAKAEFYWGLRMRLAANELSGLTDEKTIGQLAGIRYKLNSRGQIEIESKQKALDRGVKYSPDRAESIMLCFATRQKVYGVLEWEKGEKAQLEKQEAAKLTTSNTTEEKQMCECGAVCTLSQGQLRCVQCGKQRPIPGKSTIAVQRSLGRDKAVPARGHLRGIDLRW